MTRKRVLGISLIIIFVLAFLYIFPPNAVLQELYWQAKIAEVESYRQQWAEQKIIKYQIGITMWENGECRRELIVENNQIVQIIKEDCGGRGVHTIDEMFSLLKKIAVKYRVCGPNSCVCDGPFVIEATYDAGYKFPKTVDTIYDEKESWRFEKTNIFGIPDFFANNTRFCTLLGYPYEWGAWDIDTFVPLK